MLFVMYNGISFLELITTLPGSLIFILLLSGTTALISAGLTKMLTDTAEIERKQRQIKAHEEEKAKIIEIAEIDVERYRKARKRYERKDTMIKQTQQKMSLQRMKPMCVTFLPLIIIMGIFGVMFGSGTIPVAVSPMNPEIIPLIGPMLSPNGMGPYINFTAFYMLCSMALNSLIQRALGIQSQASGGGLSQMMSGQKTKALEFPDL